MDSVRTQNDSLTPSQRQAVTARGNVLVMAGAGTGKTHTLVERCLHCLCEEQPPASLEEILVVTFTEAAAAEMRRRLRRALEDALVSRPSTLDQHWAEQLALFDTAHIGTLHSFCLKLVREHFHELGLDPQLAVLDAGEARLLADETLDEELQEHYAGQNELAEAVQKLIQIYGGGRDQTIRQLVLRLHHYAQTRPDADGWLARQIEHFASPAPDEWRVWLLDGIRAWRDEWLPVLENLQAENEKATELLGIFSRLGSAPAPGAVRRAPAPNTNAVEKTNGRQMSSPNANDEGVVGHTRGACAPQFTRSAAAEILEQINSADGNWPAKRKTALRKPLEKFFADAAFLHSLAPVKDGHDPLAEDWDWVRGHMGALLRLTQNFAARFAARKREVGVLDFHDLEQFALKLLWDFAANRPSAAAERWRTKIRFVFVDEYQDINAAQDKIIQALSRDDGWGETPGEPLAMAELESTDGSRLRGDEAATAAQARGRSPHRANRFLVGDVKQSIYRFRLADPKIFRDYAQSWRGQNGQTIHLSENFRSREGLLNFVNSVFEPLMRPEIGGVGYDAEARLQFGAPKSRAELSATSDSSPWAELHLLFKKGRDDAGGGDESGDDDLADLQETEREARLLALRLKQLEAEKYKIWDAGGKLFRPAGWRDMAVLLRSPSGKAEIYAKEFGRAGVPLVVERGGFYDSAEILDLLSLLQLLDNPLQDVPAIAVLRSPLVGLSLDELAQIRLAAKGVHFWTALNRTQNAECGMRNETVQKIRGFLDRFRRWRQLARQASLSQCLESVLAETHYAEWLLARPRGAQRRANIERFLGLVQKFDQFQRQGLFRFLKFIEAQREAGVEPDVASVAEENAVRLMSIHQSKGLEFPIVAVADLAKPFNTQDLRGEIIFDESFGLCPRIKTPRTGRRYPSLPHWLAQQHQRREQWGEELRLLYVATTRAQDTLILTGAITEKKWETLWTQPAAITTQAIVAAKSYADWLGLWFAQKQVQRVHSPQSTVQSELAGELPHLRWRIADDAELRDDSISRSRGDEAHSSKLEISETPHIVSYKNTNELDAATAERLRAMLSWEYPFAAATQRPAKSSVTALRRQAEEERDNEAAQFLRLPFSAKRLAPSAENPKLSAAETGTAHHKFLQHVALENAADVAALESEAGRLERGKVLSADERAALNLEDIAAFWSSEPGQKIRAQAADVRRELAFTARFSPAELAAITGVKSEPGLEAEFVVVQGVADLVVLLPKEIWLVDFKTDEIRKDELPDRIKIYTPQLKLYAQALGKIYSRPITARWLHFLAARKTVEL
jgi:ATP-dependent helicase/nuclease subunit A